MHSKTWEPPANGDTVTCMAAAGKGDGSRGADNTNSATTGDDIDGFAVAVVREDTRWNVTALEPSALTDLADAERQLRALRATSAVFGLLNVDDEFFIIVRPAPGGSQLLLSDATAAVDYDIAVDVLDALNVEVPDIDPDETDESAGEQTPTLERPEPAASRLVRLRARLARSQSGLGKGLLAYF